MICLLRKFILPPGLLTELKGPIGLKTHTKKGQLNARKTTKPKKNQQDFILSTNSSSGGGCNHETDHAV